MVLNSTEHQQRLDLQDSCHAYIPGLETSYNYVPSLAAGVLFCVLFGLSMVVHIVQFTWKRTWWCSVFAIGCLVELLGWAARAWSSQCPYMSTAFLMQISTLIIAPTFYTAGAYILLGRLIKIFGRNSSALSPNLYLWIFCTCDVLSLVIQALGGGIASGEANKVNGNTAPGTNIMVVGIIFQMASITVFVLFAADFLRRTMRKRLLQSWSHPAVPLLGAMVLSAVCIYIRSIYRTIELLQGWNGYLITTQRFFIALDASMMVIAVAIFNVIHPGCYLPRIKIVESSSHSVEMVLGETI